MFVEKLRNIPLYYRTYKHYKPTQIGWKCWLSLKRPFYHRFGFLVESLYKRGTEGLSLSDAIILKGIEECHEQNGGKEELEMLSRQSGQILSNRFTFLNHTVDFCDKVKWENNGQSILWN